LASDAKWRQELGEHLTPPDVRYTRILPGENVEQEIRVTDVGRLSRAASIELAHKAGAERVVWGTIGETKSRQSIETFSEIVVRRMVVKNPDGTSTTRWVEVPIQVIARTRTVDVDLDYEIVSTAGGGTLARRHDVRSMRARVLWTAMTPVGAPDTYALYSDAAKAADPERCKRLETRWKAVVGDGATLSQVLEAKRTSGRESSSTAMARVLAGAAVVLLEGLPSTEELALAALTSGWTTVRQDLVSLDVIDDVEIEAPAAVSNDE